VAGIEEPRVNHHEGCLKEPEEPFVPQYWGHVVYIRSGELQACLGEILDCSVDGTGSDQCHGDVKRDQGGTEIRGEDSSSLAFAVEV